MCLSKMYRRHLAIQRIFTHAVVDVDPLLSAVFGEPSLFAMSGFVFVSVHGVGSNAGVIVLDIRENATGTNLGLRGQSL
jgi:hypothetical protein